MEVTYPDLIMGRRIGQGACSSVNMARHSETGEMFAVKMFNVYDEVCFTTVDFLKMAIICSFILLMIILMTSLNCRSHSESIKAADKRNLHVVGRSV